MGPERRHVFALLAHSVQHLTSLGKPGHAGRRGRAWPTNPALRTTSPNATNEDPCEPFARMNHTRSDTPPSGATSCTSGEPDQAFRHIQHGTIQGILEPRTTIARRKTRPAFIGRQHASALARGAPPPSRTAGESAGRGGGGGGGGTARTEREQWSGWCGNRWLRLRVVLGCQVGGASRIRRRRVVLSWENAVQVCTDVYRAHERMAANLDHAYIDVLVYTW